MLIGLATAAIPIIIHLLNRRRHRTVKWAAMQFILKATRESRGKKRLRHIMILTCRALALAALFFALAQPLASGLLGWGSGKVDTVVLVLDRSSSMEARPDNSNESKRQRVLQRVADSIEQLDGARLILIDSATGLAEEVPSPDVLAELSSTAATDTSADLPELMNSAIDYLAENSSGNSEIWVASDLQESDWAPDSARWEVIRSGLATLENEPAIRVLAARENPSINYQVELLSVLRDADNLNLQIRITRSKDTGPAALQVTYAIGGAPSGEEVTIDGQSLTFEKRIPLAKEEVGGWGYVSVQADQAPRDNVAFFSFGSKKSTLTYIVTESTDEEMAVNLARVSALEGYKPQEVQVIQPKDLFTIDWEATSLIVWQGKLPQEAAANQMESYLSKGGAAIFLPSNEIDDTKFIEHSWGQIQVSEDEQYFIPGPWDQQDGLLRDGEDGVTIPVDRLRAIKRQPLNGPSLPLASWDDEMPLLSRHIVDQGTAYFFTTLPDYSWSNLGDPIVLLPVVQRAINVGSERLGSSFAAVVNRGEALAQPSEGRERLDDFFSDESNADETFLAGVYRLGERTVAANRPTSENSPSRLNDKVVEALFDGTRFSLFDQTGSDDGSLVTPFWRPFVIAMILFLFGEALLCLPKRVKPETGDRPS